MNDDQNNHLADPNSGRRGSWTSRIILSLLACGIGLWLGTGTRNVAAGGGTAKRPVAPQTAIADLFRFDILLAGKEFTLQPVRPEAAPKRQRKLPAEVLVAMGQRPEPVSSAIPKTLACARPRFMITAPVGPWRMKLGANMARLEHRQEGVNVLQGTLTGMSAADRNSIQVELDKACEQIGSLRMEQAIHVAEPLEPLAAIAEAWPEVGSQIMP